MTLLTQKRQMMYDWVKQAQSEMNIQDATSEPLEVNISIKSN